MAGPVATYRMKLFWRAVDAAADGAAPESDPIELAAASRDLAMDEAERYWAGFAVRPRPSGFVLWEDDVRFYSYERTL